MYRLPSDPPPALHVLEEDYERLSDLVCAAPRETVAIALLWSELSRARIVTPEHAPSGLVRMNSVVRFTDLVTGEQREVRLIYPDSAGCKPDEVRADSTLGAALIGLREGATLAWNSGADGFGAIRVETVGATLPRRPHRNKTPARHPARPGQPRRLP